MTKTVALKSPGVPESKSLWKVVVRTRNSESAEQDARTNNLSDAGRASLDLALRRTVQRCGVVRVRTRDSKPPPI